MPVSDKVLDEPYLFTPKVGDMVKLVKGNPNFWNEKGLMDKFENTIQVIETVLEDGLGIKVYFKNGGEHNSEIRNPDIINSWYWRPARKCMILIKKQSITLKVKVKF